DHLRERALGGARGQGSGHAGARHVAARRAASRGVPVGNAARHRGRAGRPQGIRGEAEAQLSGPLGGSGRAEAAPRCGAQPAAPARGQPQRPPHGGGPWTGGSRSDLISAAVLLPVTGGPSGSSGPHILFSKKSADVPHHKGQFAFPGGIVEERDGSRVETALREAWEEIKLPADAVEVLGLLDDTETRATPFVITPVVGIVTRPVVFEPDGREIERV